MVKDVVSGIVTNGGEYLVLKRSLDTCSPGEWEFVSGFIEKKESPEHAVLREVREETGLAGKILQSYRPIVIFGKNDTYLFRPYLVEVKSRDVLFSEEHIEMKWVGKDCLKGYDGLVKEIAALIS
ncbi:MAG: NUDIX domain-containing protein [Nanoarchaeota archaeon]